MHELYKKYIKALKEIYNTPQGKDIFEYLKMTYSYPSCFDTDTNTLVYKLAQKELIQNLILEATLDDEKNIPDNVSYL